MRHGEKLRRDGVEGFLSPQGFNFSWTQYQDNLIQNLNRLTVDTPEATLSPKELLIHTSRWSDKAATFNYASMAFNNQFFFDGLHPSAPVPDTAAGQVRSDIIPRELNADICNSFSSFDTLREEMIKTANAMFGPGFVWITKDVTVGMMKLLTTYQAGTPFPAGHARRQPVDMNTVTTNVISGRQLTPSEHNRRLTEVQNRIGSFGPYSRAADSSSSLAPGVAMDSVPILCVKVWEHGWLYDYGIGPRSKQLYLERWWESVDWDHVWRRALEVRSNSSSSLGGVSEAFRRPGGAARSYA